MDKNDSDPLRARRPELAKVLSHPPLSHPSRIILCHDVIAKSSFIVWQENGHVGKTVGLTKTGSEKLRRVNRPDASSLDGRNNEVCPALTFLQNLSQAGHLTGMFEQLPPTQLLRESPSPLEVDNFTENSIPK